MEKAMNKLNKILYVEDERDIQTVVQIALENVGGFTLKPCFSGVEAINSAAEFNPDLLLLDVMMPEMDGPATLLKLKQIPALENTPVIFMTAKVQPDEIEYLKSLGAIDVIPKPFDPMTLANQITSIWEKHNN